MKKLALATILLGSALSTNSFAIEFIGGGHIIDHTQTITKGNNGSLIEMSYTGKKSLTKSSTCDASIGSVQGFVNQNLGIIGDMDYRIQNNQEGSQTYEIEADTSTSDGQKNHNVWHIEIDAGGQATDQIEEPLTILYQQVGTWASYSDLYVRGIDGCESHGQGSIAVISESLFKK